MQGAREFAELFGTGQHGRLFLVSGEHARGRTFHIYVLPEEVEVPKNGPRSASYLNGAVEVYGIVSGQPGWTESYGWLHEGKWVADFEKLVDERRQQKAEQERQRAEALLALQQAKTAKEKALLANY